MENNIQKKKQKVLKYPCAHIEGSDEIMVAENITDENRNLQYYLIADSEDGEIIHVPLIAVKCRGAKRNYFKRYPENSKYYIRPEIKINLNGYRELSAHAYFKYLITSGEVNQIHVESLVTNINGLETKIKGERVIHITNGKDEVPDKLGKQLRAVVYDVVVDSKELGRVALECYVTHKVDDIKKEKLRKLDINALELNLSCLKDKDGILTDEDKNNIKYMVETMKFSWVNSVYKNDIDEYESQVQNGFEGNKLLQAYRSKRPERGQKFYLLRPDAGDICFAVKSGRCPVEGYCLECKRMVAYSWDDSTIEGEVSRDNYVICNQSKERPITRRWLMEQIKDGLNI